MTYGGGLRSSSKTKAVVLVPISLKEYPISKGAIVRRISDWQFAAPCEDVPMQQQRASIATPVLLLVLVAAIVGTPLALSGDLEESQAVQPRTQIDTYHHAAVLQSKCCSCGGAFPREVARLCNSCSNKYRSKCCLCSGAFPQDAARLCSSCTNRFRNKCFLCSGAFPKDIARICSRCASKY
jgi:hypothetical protein